MVKERKILEISSDDYIKYCGRAEENLNSNICPEKVSSEESFPLLRIKRKSVLCKRNI